jgi:hypothetical protein
LQRSDVKPAAPPIFGWYPDPAGRHELRYFDGRLWTDWVRDGETAGSDPIEPPRPPWESAERSEDDQPSG